MLLLLEWGPLVAPSLLTERERAAHCDKNGRLVNIAWHTFLRAVEKGRGIAKSTNTLILTQAIGLREILYWRIKRFGWVIRLYSRRDASLGVLALYGIGYDIN